MKAFVSTFLNFLNSDYKMGNLERLIFCIILQQIFFQKLLKKE